MGAMWPKFGQPPAGAPSRSRVYLVLQVGKSLYAQGTVADATWIPSTSCSRRCGTLTPESPNGFPLVTVSPLRKYGHPSRGIAVLTLEPRWTPVGAPTCSPDTGMCRSSWPEEEDALLVMNDIRLIHAMHDYRH